MSAKETRESTVYQETISIESEETEGVIAWSEAYFALAHIARTSGNLLPALKDYGMEQDPAIARQIERDIARLRSEVDEYEKAIRTLEAAAR